MDVTRRKRVEEVPWSIEPMSEGVEVDDGERRLESMDWLMLTLQMCVAMLFVRSKGGALRT